MTKKEFFEVTEAIFTIALFLFFVFFKDDTDPYAGKLIKDGIFYTIIDYILCALMYIFTFAAIGGGFYIKSKIKKVLWVLAMYSAVVACEALRFPLLEFSEEIVDRLEIYPYYGIAILVWSSVYIIDYFVGRYNKKGEA